MLTIRFNRVGKKNRASYRIVVQEHTIAPGGGHVEVLGSYDPHLKKGVFRNERIKHWVEKGVQISDSVFNLLLKEKVIEGDKRKMNIRKTKKKDKEGEGENNPEGGKSEEGDKKEEKSSKEPKDEVKKEESKEGESAEKKEELKPEEKKE